MFAMDDPRYGTLSLLSPRFSCYQLEEIPQSRESFFHIDRSSFAGAFQATLFVGPVLFHLSRMRAAAKFNSTNIDVRINDFTFWSLQRLIS